MRLKLISPKDTLLGHIDVPEEWRELLERRGAVRTLILPEWRIFSPAADEPAVAASIEDIVLIQAKWSRYPEAVCLARGTTEQLEVLPQCSFTPSMAYLRSQLP